MEEKPAQTIREENAVTEKECRCRKKLSGDLRIFIIALLTSVIVVLAYHGIRYSFDRMQCRKAAFACRKNFCIKQPDQQQFPGKKFHGHRHFPQKEFKCSSCGKSESRRFHRQMKNLPERPEKAEKTAVTE